MDEKQHSRGAVAEADRDLELRRKDARAEPKPPPPDIATQRWLPDSDDV